MRLPRTAAALALLALPLHAQDPDRDTAFGEVRDAAGQPWVGATVVLMSELVPTRSREFAFDELTVKTDDRGRFRAELLVQRDYVAFAWDPQSPAAGHRYTRTGPPLRARNRVVLHEAAGRLRAGSLQLRDADTASADGPFRVAAVFTLGHDRHGVLARQGDGTYPLPPWPGTTLLRVYDKHGRLRAEGTHDSRMSTRTTLRIEALESRGYLVHGKDGKPIAGAVAHAISMSRNPADPRAPIQRVFPIGTCDADGHVRLVPGRQRGTPFTAMFTAPGHACATELGRGKAGNADELRKMELAQLPADTLTLRIRPGQDCAPVCVIRDVPLVYMPPGGPAGGFVAGYLPRADVVESGRLSVPGELKEIHAHFKGSATLRVLLSQQARAQLPDAWRPHLPWVVELPEECLRPFANKELDLRSCVPVRVRVADHRGNPVAGAGVALGLPTDETLLGAGGQSEALAVSDRSGLAHLLVPPGSRIHLMCRYPAQSAAAWSFAQAEVHALPGPMQESFTELRLRLTEPVRIAGKVVDAAGEPQADASVRVFLGEVADALQMARVAHVQPDRLEPGELTESDRRLRYLILAAGEMVAPRQHDFFFRLEPVKTDAQGRFELVLPTHIGKDSQTYTVACERSLFGLFAKKARVVVESSAGKPIPEQKLVLR